MLLTFTPLHLSESHSGKVLQLQWDWSGIVFLLLRKQRWADLCEFNSSLGLHSELQYSQGCKEGPCLKNKANKDTHSTQDFIHSWLLLLPKVVCQLFLYFCLNTQKSIKLYEHWDLALSNLHWSLLVEWIWFWKSPVLCLNIYYPKGRTIWWFSLLMSSCVVLQV